jgi:hypothetical protein
MSSPDKHKSSADSHDLAEGAAAERRPPEKSRHVKMDLGPFANLGGDAGRDAHALDLTIEQVEERITPGETNVFDK